jgi:DNA repair protein SbcD/Mre11
MYKVLHTADWHIGKVLYRQELEQEMRLYLDWLIDYVAREHIDLLLVSGDIFDLANPGHKEIKLYYETLRRLADAGCQIIVTGGNHDSISLLDAPHQVLEVLQVKVIGGARADLEEEIIAVHDKSGTLACVVLAVPFLRDKDLRQSKVASDIDVAESRIQNAIAAHYDACVEMSIEKYGTEVPLIAMGHLYMQGAETSESEREIHIGTLQGISEDILSSHIDYMALGHIHKPQRVQKKDHVRYSGSPIFLDFSERNYEKIMIQLTIDKSTIQSIDKVAIPCFRSVIRIEGTWKEITASIADLKYTSTLPPYIELHIVEETFDPALHVEIEAWLSEVDSDQYKILKNRTTILSQGQQHESLQESVSITDLKPIEVFYRALDQYGIEQEHRESVLAAYNEIIEDMQD